MKTYSVISVVVLFTALLHLAACQSDAPKCIQGCHCTFAGDGALNVNCSRRGLKEVKNIFDVLTNLPSSVSLDFSGNEITTVRRNDFTVPPTFPNASVSISSIDLRRNQIITVEDGTFALRNIRGLSALYLSENRIESFELDTFDRQPFSFLDLSHNRLRSYPYAINKGLHGTLRLNNNPIGNLPDDAFTAYTDGIEARVLPFAGLTELDLSAVGMTTFDSCALQIDNVFKRLQRLYLDENNFVRVTRSFFPCMFKPLDTLSMRRCGTQGYDRDAFGSGDYQRNTLQRLHLSGNNLTILERRGFRYLDDLLELDLSNCSITNILRNAFLGVNIHDTLDLSYNNIREIHNLDFSDIQSVKTIDLSHSNIQRITGRPFENLTRLEVLNLSNNNISVIDGSEFFSKDSQLYSLDLSHSNIKVIARKPFKYLNRLKTLDLSENDISEIPSEVFSKLSSLKSLQLSHSNITKLANNSFKTLTSLEKLDISHNNISEINDEVFNDLISVTELTLTHSLVQNFTGRPFEKLPKLERLWLDENFLTVESFVAALAGTRYLHTLDLSRNMLTKVPNLKRNDFPDLTNLFLSFNKIKKIHREDLKGMGFLRELVLKDNNIEEIERDAFAECPNITVLDIDGSQLTVLPDLSYMPQLRNLHLNRGRITELPDDICVGHPHLTIIEVEDNFLTRLPSFSRCYPGLTLGIFAQNLIETLPVDTFANQRIMRWLDLSHNRLTELPIGLFNDTVDLEVLYVSFNELTSLSPNHFEKMVNLVRFDASNNQIGSLEDGLFKYNTEMDVVLLNNNEIATISDTVFPVNNELKRIDLSHNGFSSWRVPSNGFPYLVYLILEGLPNLFQVPSTFMTPHVVDVKYTYPYHCCIWRHYTAPPADDNQNLSSVTPTTVATAAPPTIPPGWDSCPPDTHRERERLEQAFKNTWNVTIILLPDCKVQINYHTVSAEGVEEDVPIGTGEQQEFSASANQFSSKLGDFLEFVPNYQRPVVCRPHPDALNPCENLMDPMFLRVAIWAIWIIALLGNGTVLFVAIGALEKLETYQFIICNLAIADFFMGVYLAFLAIVDIRTFGDQSFYQSALSWQLGPGCKTAGFIAVFASELSMYMLVLLTLERVYTISYGFNKTERSKMKVAVILAIIGWLFAIFLAVLPLVGINSYTQVAVCLPYMTSNWYDRAYIGFILSINLLGFLVILGSYLYIFYRIRNSPAQPPTKTGTIATAALKIAVLIVSALICWAPIAVIGYAALAGKALVTVEEAKYFIVFVYPVNACINPFIYAIFTRHFRHKIGSFFKRTKDKVASFPNQHSIRLHRNSIFPPDLSRVNSPRSNPSPEELRRLRHSRRSNSFSLQYVDPASAVVQNQSPTARISPPAGVYMGRRSSLPAAFGSTLGACAPCSRILGTAGAAVGGNNTPAYQLPFRLGPLYTSENNNSAPNIPEEAEMKETAAAAILVTSQMGGIIGERATLGGSQDSSLRRLSIVEEEEEMEEVEPTTKGVESTPLKGLELHVPTAEEDELESVSIASSDSEDYIEASEHPIDIVVEKSTDLDAAAAAAVSHRGGLKRTIEADVLPVETSPTTGKSGSNMRNLSSSSLNDVVIADEPEIVKLKPEVERLSREARGTSKLSTDSACSGYCSSALDDALVAYSPDQSKFISCEQQVLRKLSTASESPVSRKSSLTCFEDARSQATLGGDTASVDSGSCHDLAVTGCHIKSENINNSNSTISSNGSSIHNTNPPSPQHTSVDQESVCHSPRSHSHSSKSHSHSGVSNPTSHTKKHIDKQHKTNSATTVYLSTDSLGVTKSETEV